MSIFDTISSWCSKQLHYICDFAEFRAYIQNTGCILRGIIVKLSFCFYTCEPDTSGTRGTVDPTRRSLPTTSPVDWWRSTVALGLIQDPVEAPIGAQRGALQPQFGVRFS